jgi:hypothetical protein
MSLYTLPVSVSDLTQLQLGIEFFTNVTEATSEAALINAAHDSVFSYANQLLANNISLSQVAMAVDSLMFGHGDNTTELAKLSTQFLPAQASHAVADGFNPTVYAAEALGLALAGGNGRSTAFASNFGSLSVSDFAADVSSLTGINIGAIQGFVQNWINFYTANPSATFGLSVTLASYGAAFGDAVGAALLNPSVSGDLALLVNEEQNALMDNAEGLYFGGTPLLSEPSQLPLSGEAFLIPDAGGAPSGPTIDWASAQFPGAALNYAEFVTTAQTGPLTINNAPTTFTLNTQHFGTGAVEIDSAGNSGNLCTLIVGDSTNEDSIGPVTVNEYQTVNIVAHAPFNDFRAFVTELTFFPTILNHGHVLISGDSFLSLGDTSSSERAGNLSVAMSGTITDVGVGLELGVTDAETIDASNAPFLNMIGPAFPATVGSGVTVLGGHGDNHLQGSLGGQVSTVTFTNTTTGLSATAVGADNITGGPAGDDLILGDGGPDVITLPPAHTHDRVGFGFDDNGSISLFDVLAITDGLDQVYHGLWDVVAGGPAQPTKIPDLFLDAATGGTSADMTTITGFQASSGNDQLIFDTAAWNGASTIMGIPANGDLVNLDGFVVSPGAAQLSAVWVNSNSNSSLNASDSVLLYAPAGGPPHDASELAAQLQGAAGAVVLPGMIPAGQDEHILVAYDATLRVFPVHPIVKIADVDLVNMSGSPQNSTNNLNVYASDMVSLTGVSLASLTPDNIHFM